MQTDFKAVEEAELRLEARGAERRLWSARRARRRALLPWLFCPLVLPALGAAGLLWALESAGGDLGEWSRGAAALLIGGAVLVPAALSAWVGRRHGAVDAILWALVTACLTVALVFGGFLLLDLGPS